MHLLASPISQIMRIITRIIRLMPGRWLFRISGGCITTKRATQTHLCSILRGSSRTDPIISIRTRQDWPRITTDLGSEEGLYNILLQTSFLTCDFRLHSRMCPGKYLASKTVWIGIVRILWAFDIAHGVDADGNLVPVDPDSCAPGLLSCVVYS